MNRCFVAQVANLLYRRLLIGEALDRRTASGLATRDTADAAVCATAEAQPDAAPEAGAHVRFMATTHVQFLEVSSLHEPAGSGTGVPPVSSATRARRPRHYFAAPVHGPDACAKAKGGFP